MTLYLSIPSSTWKPKAHAPSGKSKIIAAAKRAAKKAGRK